MKQEDMIDDLETIVDQATLKEVIDALATVAYLKAQHIRENWQDNATAKPWNAAARKLDTLSTKIEI